MYVPCTSRTPSGLSRRASSSAAHRIFFDSQTASNVDCSTGSIDHFSRTAAWSFGHDVSGGGLPASPYPYTGLLMRH